MKSETVAKKVAREQCAKFPETPSHSLARKLVKKHPELYKDVETARFLIRSVRGKTGDKNRATTKDKSQFRSTITANPIRIPEPEPDSDDYKPYVLPKLNNNILHIQDMHIPYHSKETIELAIDYAIGKGVNTVLIGYDFLDFYMLSRFQKDPRKRRFAEEIKAANEMLDYFQYRMPKAKIFFRAGNHDMRLLSYLLVKATELLDLEVLTLNDLLKFKKRGITEIGDNVVVQAGKLSIIHGHEYMGGNGSSVNPARGLYLKAGNSALCGHSHKTSTHTDPDITGNVFTTFSVGCACGLHPEYARLNKWNLGFAHILTYPDGTFHVNNMQVHKGKIY